MLIYLKQLQRLINNNDIFTFLILQQQHYKTELHSYSMLALWCLPYCDYSLNGKKKEKKCDAVISLHIHFYTNMPEPFWVKKHVNSHNGSIHSLFGSLYKRFVDNKKI